MAFRHLVVVLTIAAGIVVSVTGLHAQQGAALTDVREGIRAARFAITIDGVEIASFTRFDSLVDRSTGATSQAIALTGGETYSPELVAWHEKAMMGDIEGSRRSCSIVMFSAEGSPIRTYHLENAWPTKYSGASIKTQRLATEGVVLIYEGVEVVPGR